MSCGKSVSAMKQPRNLRGFKDVHNHAKKKKMKWERKQKIPFSVHQESLVTLCKKSNSCCIGKKLV